MSCHHLAAAGLVLFCHAAPGFAQQQPPPRELGIKYMRDSEEYATLARQIYRMAGEAVERAATAGAGGPWAVVLDVDETALDNSAYQLERAAYGQPFEPASWAAWIERREAAAVPGVVRFIQLVRHAGGRVAWISNRDARLTDPTRANLEALGLWDAGDRMCAQKSPQHTKAERRREVVAGQGDCSWSGSPMRVVAFVGDQLGDFPTASEQIAEAGLDAAFGHHCFLLPNSMYGAWTSAATRSPAMK
jgi:5'-nucleotidase (lipoprotein e(P4) family)